MDLDKQLKENNDFESLQDKIISWGEEREIIFPENANKQLLKSFSEMGELSDALLKNDIPEIIDGLGDVLVTLIILSANLNLDLVDCLESAYSEIKDRKGVTVNGTFVKE